MFELDLRDRRPIYEQLVDKFKQLIFSDILKQDEQLPSVRSLAQELSINPNTIQKAYRELETQGYIYSVKGKGSFVNQLAEIDNRSELEELSKQLQKLMREALFLGMTKEDLYQLIEESQSL
ncbi:GntR family transcriptional regulator [Gracilibacillus alcaliphilus]|uniref:GntR family transcriptional regulator n=1 Tax=Gracilibacillus alcaliphilus TaxID=1401441 RepID=UPI00195772F2|nr:GntR family transcriptional regulator [Gracilibacillus alcaliphilus]MBM7675821.1 GntR family transcriptional regulator [Gracilibacillus alcaliphilus]